MFCIDIIWFGCHFCWRCCCCCVRCTHCTKVCLWRQKAHTDNQSVCLLFGSLITLSYCCSSFVRIVCARPFSAHLLGLLLLSSAPWAHAKSYFMCTETEWVTSAMFFHIKPGKKLFIRSRIQIMCPTRQTKFAFFASYLFSFLSSKYNMIATMCTIISFIQKEKEYKNVNKERREEKIYFLICQTDFGFDEWHKHFDGYPRQYFLFPFCVDFIRITWCTTKMCEKMKKS